VRVQIVCSTSSNKPRLNARAPKPS
jgi:hypothetical protein